MHFSKSECTRKGFASSKTQEFPPLMIFPSIVVHEGYELAGPV